MIDIKLTIIKLLNYALKYLDLRNVNVSLQSYEFVEDGSSYAVESFSGEVSKLVLPSSYNGKPVNKVNGLAFYGISFNEPSYGDDDYEIGGSIVTPEVDGKAALAIDEVYFSKPSDGSGYYLDNSSFYRSYKILEAIINKANISNDEYESFDKSGPFFLLSKKVLESIYTLEEISNQEKLVSSIHFDFNSKRGELIRFTSINAKDELKRLAYEGLKNKLNELDERYVARLEYELKIINQMNFNDYFLLVADYVNYFRKAGVKIGPGRGSCVGSLVAYALDIVQIDPIKYNLYFERFLNPSRHGLPDIDIDVEDDKRNDVITYLKNKYGANKVGLILTYSTLQLKAAIRRIGMVFNQIPPSRINLLVNSLPNKPIKLEEELANNYRFKKLIQDPYFASILDKAKLILDYPISFSTHASGVIISSDDLFNKVPVSISNINIINYEFKFLEDMGYLKLDVLGLSNLTFIKQIEHLIELDDKKLVNPYLDLENKKTYEILNKLLVIDIFQLESAGIQQVISQIKPNNILDNLLIALLYP